MARTLRLKRGTTSQNAAYTGAEGEVTYDTQAKTLIVHDGVTAGGHKLISDTGSVELIPWSLTVPDTLPAVAVAGSFLEVTNAGTYNTVTFGSEDVGVVLSDGTTVVRIPASAASESFVAAAIAAAEKPQTIAVACSDETTALTAGAGKVTFRMPYAFTLQEVRASLTTAQTSGSIFTVDVNEGGASVFSTTLTIDNTEKTSTTATTPAVISDAALADDAEITIDIDQIGDGTANGLKVYLIGTVV